MRLKEFIVFIIVFTICYIIFFIIYDKVHFIRSVEKQRKLAQSLIQNSKYLLFAQFYGIQGTALPDKIFSIYENLPNYKENSISKLANSYQVDSYELVVIILYLEYLQLISRKTISLKEDCFRNVSFADQNMIQKYIPFFQNKSNYQDISSSFGRGVYNDLDYLDKHFLIPGLRFVNSIVYYVGDYL